MTAVTDTSVVLNFCWLGLDSLLAQLFDRVLRAQIAALTAE